MSTILFITVIFIKIFLCIFHKATIIIISHPHLLLLWYVSYANLYGLKQAFRSWFTKFNTTFISQCFKESKYDYTLFTKGFNSSIAILVSINDIVIAIKNFTHLLCYVQLLSSTSMKLIVIKLILKIYLI